MLTLILTLKLRFPISSLWKKQVRGWDLCHLTKTCTINSSYGMVSSKLVLHQSWEKDFNSHQQRSPQPHSGMERVYILQIAVLKLLLNRSTQQKGPPGKVSYFFVRLPWEICKKSISLCSWANLSLSITRSMAWASLSLSLLGSKIWTVDRKRTTFYLVKWPYARLMLFSSTQAS